MGFIKQLFCKHRWRFHRNVYGDQIIAYRYKRSVWRCDLCGKFDYRDQLHNSEETEGHANG